MINDFHKILSFPNIHCLRSSAGSGKTFSLASWYIRILFSAKAFCYNNENTDESEDKRFSKILAITFTNKASKEMKERIIAFIKAIALSKKPLIDSIKYYPELKSIQDPAIIDRSKALLKMIFKNYEQFNVRTIDSFISSILRTLSLHAGLNPNFEISEDKEDFIKNVLREYISLSLREQSSEDTILLKSIINSLFFFDFDSYFPENNIIDTVSSLFIQNESIYAMTFNEISYFEEVIRQFFFKISEGTKEFKNICESNSLKSCKNFSKLIEKLLDLSKNNNESWRIFQKAIKSKYLRKNMDGFFLKKPVIQKEYFELWNEILGYIANILEYKAITFYSEHIKFYNRVKSEIDLQKRKLGILFIDDLNRILKEYIEKSESDRIILLDSFLEHFLIDEFQDTNQLQIDNLKPFIEEALAKRGSLFYVGDKKQSIYRFRGSDSTIFHKIQAQFALKPAISSLDMNYRSLKNIVDFNNKIFCHDNIAVFVNYIFREALKGAEYSQNTVNEKIERIIDDYRDSAQKSYRAGEREKGFISVKVLTEERSKGFEYLARLLNEDLLNRYRKRDIALLTFKNQESRELSRFLADCQIPAISDNSLDIRENRTVKPVISLLNFLVNPSSDKYLFEFILSNVFCMWFSKHRKGFCRETILDIIEGKRPGKRLLETVFEELPEFSTKFLEPIYSLFRVKPFYSFCRDLCGSNMLDITSRFPHDTIFIYKLFEFLQVSGEKLEYSTEKILEILNSENRNKDLEIEASQDIDSVRILTIHKSKGLQFPVVIIPSISFNFNKNLRINDIASVKNNKIQLYRISKNEIHLSEKLFDLYAGELALNISDSLNMLYVAFTRPSEELYLFFSENEGRKGYTNLLQSFNDLSNNKEFTIGTKTRKIAPPSDESPLPVMGRKQAKRWEDLLLRDKEGISEVFDYQTLQDIKIHELLIIYLDHYRHSPENIEKSIKIFLKSQGISQSQSNIITGFENRIALIMQNYLVSKILTDSNTLSNYCIINMEGIKLKFNKILFIHDKMEIYIMNYTMPEADYESISGSLKSLKLLYPACRITYSELNLKNGTISIRGEP